MDGGQPYNPRTVEEVFRDFKGRRAGMIKALTTDVEEFYRQCDPEKENLCLYGFPSEQWEVNLPAEEVPPELPEPALGINFARDGMQEKDWLSLVAVHSDAWLLAVSFYFGARFGFDKADRKRLFNMINDLPTIFEVVTGTAKKQVKEKSLVSNNISNKSNKSNSKRTQRREREREREREDHRRQRRPPATPSTTPQASADEDTGWRHRGHQPTPMTPLAAEDHEVEQDKPCDLCGDIGVFDAIFTCSKCKTNREHVYCMRNHPKKGDDIWVCEACEKSKEIVSPKYGEKKDLPETVLSNSSGPVHHMGRRVCWEKKVKTGKVKYMPAHEAIQLSSGAKKESSTKVNLHQSVEPSKTMASMPVREPVKCKTAPLNLSSYMAKPNPSFRPGHLKSPKHGGVKINSTVQQVTPTSKELHGKQSDLTPTKEDTHKEQAVGSLNPSEEIGTIGERVEKAINNPSCAFSSSTCCPNITSPGGKLCTDVEPINSEAENWSMVNILPPVENLCPNHPALSASWKGIFKILDIKDGGLNDGFEAHPSYRVRRKVYEFSKRMPEVLQFEMLPRSKFWKDMFNDDTPDRDDIGLYFFSRDGEGSENYIFLLEYLEMHDLLMRSYVDGVELLVLTSKLLSLDSQSWKEHYFLWGVFRRVRNGEAIIKEHKEPPLLTHALDCTNGEDDDVVDMDIDMVGGENVGRVDVSIQKVSSKQGSKISEETVDLITLHGSNATSPAASKKLDYPIEKQLLEVKKEYWKDIPPGFEETCGSKFKASFCKTGLREENMSPAKESKTLKRVSEAFGDDNLKPKKPTEDSYLQGLQEKHHQGADAKTMDSEATYSSPVSVKNDRLGLAVKVEKPDDKIHIGNRCQSLRSEFGGSPDSFSHHPRSPVKIKREVP